MNAAIKLLLKLVQFRDLVPIVLEHLPVDTLKKYRGIFTGPNSPLRAAGAGWAGGDAAHPYRMLQASVATFVGKLLESLGQYDDDTMEFLCQMVAARTLRLGGGGGGGGEGILPGG